MNHKKMSKKNKIITLVLLTSLLVSAGTAVYGSDGTGSSSAEARLATLKTISNADETRREEAINTVNIDIPDVTGAYDIEQMAKEEPVITSSAEVTKSGSDIKGDSDLFMTKHEITAETEDPSKFKKFLDSVPDYGGYIRYCNYNSEVGATSVLTYIPTDKADKFLKDAFADSEMLSDAISTNNIQGDYSTLKQKKASLEEQKELLTSQLKKNPLNSDLKKDLEEINTELQSNATEIANYEDSAQYTEFSIDVSKHETLGDSFFSMLKRIGNVLVLFTITSCIIATFVGTIFLFIRFSKWVFNPLRRRIELAAATDATAYAEPSSIADPVRGNDSESAI